MNKFFLHPSAFLQEDGKLICQYCGMEIPSDMKTSFPCSESVSAPFDREIEVNVWNCEARLVVGKKLMDLSKLRSREAKKLVRLMEKSVYDVGVSMNRSGIYPPSKKLCSYVKSLKLGEY
jgi:hypothetical protein